MAMKYKWVAAPVPTGRYRSFESRGWPKVEFANGEYGGGVFCTEDGLCGSYVPRKVRTGDHAPLKVQVINFADNKKRCRLKGEFATLDEAKAAYKRFVEANPDFSPKEA